MKSTQKITRSVKASQVFRLKLAVLAVAACFSPLALANPVGPVVVNGAATIVNSGNTLTVTNTPGAILNWQQFNIGQGQTTQFIQQSAQSSVLNRVTGPDPSQILGTMRSNGQVFLINPNGIMFGAGAVIDVNRLIASTLNITNADFLANNLKFNGNNGTSVINQGQITTPFGGSVYLIGNDVTNQGVITTPQGEVVLAAGNSVSLVNSVTPHISVTVSAGGQALNLGQVTAQGGSINIYGALVKQQGIVSADSASVDAQGNIMLSATQSVDLAQGSSTSAKGATGGNITLDLGATGATSVAGAAEASGSNGAGGTIKVLGNTIALTDTARLDASGTAGGGTILVGGDYQGKNAAVQNAFTTSIAQGAAIRADATLNGNGGKIIAWSDDTTHAYGSFSARGGAQSGNGGLIETSGHYLDVAGIKIDAAAQNGTGGTWLLDPYDVTIQAPVGTLDGLSPAFVANANTSTVSNTVIQAALAAGIWVYISTNNSVAGAQSGNITVDAPITAAVIGAGTELHLDAIGNIIINQPITSTNAPLNLTLHHGAAGNTTLAGILSLAGGNVDVGTYTGPTGVCTPAVGTLNVTAGSTTLTGTLAANALAISGGVLGLNTSSPVTLQSLTMSGGTLGGTGAVTISGPFNVTGTSILTGTGTFTTQGTSLISMAATNGYVGFGFSGGKTWINQGTLTVGDDDYISFSNNNNNILNNAVGATLNLSSSYAAPLNSSGFVLNTVNNAGTLNQTLTGSHAVGTFFNNTGTVNVVAGTLQLDGNLSGADTGTYNIASGTTLSLNAGIRAFNAGSNITGTGTLAISGGAEVNVSALTGITAGVALNNGTLNFNIPVTLSSLTMSGGTLGGTGAVTVSGAFNATGTSTLAGTGTFTTQGASLISMATANGYIDLSGGRTWVNQGTLTVGGDDYISFGLGGGTNTLSNAVGGTLNLSSSNANPLAIFGGTSVVENYGTLNQTLTGSHNGLAVNNFSTGTINVNAGTLVGVGGYNYGIINIATGATLSKAAGITNTGTLSGTGAIAVGTGPSGLINQGNINPGGTGAAGTLAITGDVLLDTGSILNMELGGTGAGQSDKLAVSGNITTTGTLNASLLGGYTPVNADAIPFMMMGGTASGTFTTASLPAGFNTGYNLAAGEAARLIYAGAGTITFTNASGGLDWAVPGNWSGGLLPGSLDTALLSTGLAVTHTTGADTIAALTINSGNSLNVSGGSLAVSGITTLGGGMTVSGTGSATLGGVLNGATSGQVSVSGGSLNLGGASSVSALSMSGGVLGTNSALTAGTASFSGGTLSGSGAVTVSGAFNATGTSALVGTGTFTTQGTSLIDIVAVNGYVDISGGKTWINQGTLTVGGDDYISFGFGGGSNTLNNAVGGTLNLSSSHANPLSHSGGTSSVLNYGTTNLTVAGVHNSTAFNNYAGGTLNVNTGTLSTCCDNAGGTINVATGATFSSSSGFTNTGTLSGSGTIAVGTGASGLINQGSINPGGTGVGTLVITGDVQLGTGSILNIGLGGAGLHQSDKLVISGNITIAGALSAGLLAGYTPVNADAIPFMMTSGTASGTFTTASLPANFSAGYNLAVNEAARLTYSYTPPAPPTCLTNPVLCDSTPVVTNPTTAPATAPLVVVPPTTAGATGNITYSPAPAAILPAVTAPATNGQPTTTAPATNGQPTTTAPVADNPPAAVVSAANNLATAPATDNLSAATAPATDTAASTASTASTTPVATTTNDVQKAKNEARKAEEEARKAEELAKQAKTSQEKAVASQHVEVKSSEVAVKSAEAKIRTAESELRAAEAEVASVKSLPEKVRAETRKAVAELRHAEGEVEKVSAEVKLAEAEAKRAKTPEAKAVAEVKKSEAEAKKASAEVKKAEVDAKKAETELKQAEVEVKTGGSREAKAVVEVKKAEVESKKAEAEIKKAEAEAKLAKDPATKAAAESKLAEAEAKKANAEARKADVEAKQADTDAKSSSSPVAKLVAETKKAEAEVKKAEAEVKKAEAEVKSSNDPEKKAKAEVKVAEAETKKAVAEAKKADTEAKKADAEAKHADAEAKKSDSPVVKQVAEAKKAEAEAKKAEAEVKKAEAEVKSAKDPEKKEKAEVKVVEAEAKKADAEAKQADAEVKVAEAKAKSSNKAEDKKEVEDKKAEAEVKKAEAEVKKAEAQVKIAKAPSEKEAAEMKRSEAEAQKAEAEFKSAEREAKHDKDQASAPQSGYLRKAVEKKAEAAVAKAEARKAEYEAKKLAAEAKRAEVEMKLAEAEAKEAKTPEARVVAEKRFEAKRTEAETKRNEAQTKEQKVASLNAEAASKETEYKDAKRSSDSKIIETFSGMSLASMAKERVQEAMLARHEFKAEALKPALNILKTEPKAADLKPCGPGSGDVCMRPVNPALANIAVDVMPRVQLPLPTPATSFLPTIQRKVAVVIGNNAYQDPNIPSLDGAVKDADAIGKLFKEKMGYDVRMVHNGTRADIVRTLNQISDETGSKDSVVVYYAGHGYQMEDTKVGYWIPSDASTKDPSKWISNSDINKMLTNIPAKQMILVSDSCYSGALTSEQKLTSAVAGKNVQEILGKRSVLVMSSGGEEPVMDEGRDGHSIFAWHLMDRLNNVEQYKNGAEVFEAVKDGVAKDGIPQTPQYGASLSAGHMAGGEYLFEVRKY